MSQTSRSTPATLHDVAREAGVSLATASRSLNGSTRKVNEAYRQKVLEAAARLGYTPNLSAQAVARGTTTTVALLVADIADPYFSSIAAGVVGQADSERLIVTMAETDRDSARELELVRAMRGQRPRVMILASSRRADDPAADALQAELTAYEQTGGRVVFISSTDQAFRTVELENRAGARALATEMVGLGYRRFGALMGPEGLRTGEDRIAGFTEGLVAAGFDLPADRTARTRFTRDGGYEGMRELIARGIGDTQLVFALNDVMAMGAMSALRDAGLEPGLDVAVAGFDDIPTVRDVTPTLTTVRLPLEEVGVRALRLALAESDADSGSPVPTEVVVRESTPRLADAV
ncbi:LacI family transcriptional regulator [Agromyces rhizosphaerae]|uniref:LacI family transcriptional regulator n=1 Tax=Agromyces rhizosphaerae TaxID=88374 RepID=A0A9W6FMU6_9MICO|nr:LacI family DNA-binding transcriptional regulator [Agromyces rhizosphaerae]GLI26264.1 LacI family transcriptional regulator [Agromyces rhizosphaerae]